MWKALRFDEVFAQLIPTGREEVPWAVMASMPVLARLGLKLAERLRRPAAMAQM